MRDPFERRTAGGEIVTGVGRQHIPSTFATVVDDAVTSITNATPEAVVFLYGSVATGEAQIGLSDVDLLTVGLGTEPAARVASALSVRHAALCRAVEIGDGRQADFVGEHDEAYGNRVFLRHYCVHLAGPSDLVPTQNFPADARAARGFNGDIGTHLDRWQTAVGCGDAPSPLARRIARKTLLAIAGLVSIIDSRWTTDRAEAARRWSEIHPSASADLIRLQEWSNLAGETSDARDVAAMLDGFVTTIVHRFALEIGLWETDPQAN